MILRILKKLTIQKPKILINTNAMDIEQKSVLTNSQWRCIEILNEFVEEFEKGFDISVEKVKKKYPHLSKEEIFKGCFLI